VIACDLVLRDVCVVGQREAWDLAIAGDRIVAAAPRLPATGRVEWDGNGRWVLPALVEPHLHLDKAFSLDRTGAADDLAGAIAATAALRRAEDRGSLLARGRRVLDRVQAWGTGAVRAHVNVDTDAGLAGVEAALTLRDEYRHRLRVQVVAFASRGLLPGRGGRDLLAEAAALGCDALGASVGIPDEPQPVLEALFDLAEARGLPLDLHVDEHTQPRCPGLEVLTPLTVARGYRGRVVAAHCSALSSVDADVRARLIARLVDAQITVVALPLSNLYLQGRSQPAGARGIAPVRQLLAAGVRVLCGSDNVQDAFLPYGNGDPLLAAVVLGVAAQLTTESERAALVPMVTTVAAQVLGLTDYGVGAGRRADLVVLDSKPPDHPVTTLPARALVVAGGRLLPGSAPGSTPTPKEGGAWTTRWT